MVQIVLISAGAFVVIVLLILGLVDMYRLAKYGDTDKVKKRMAVRAGAASLEAIDIIRKDAMSQQSFVDLLQEKVSPIGNLKDLLRQADSDMPVGVFLMISGLGLVLGLIGGLFLGQGGVILLGLGAFGASIPYVAMRRKRNKRLSEIEAQLPDALDLISRTLLAGHAFMMGLKLVGDQLEDPLAKEFRKAFEEINFGLSVAEAMKGLSDRVDSVDVRFFVTSLLVQLETGGNLAEIIASISRLIRARFELLGKIQALSAEGRISAGIMFALPLFVGTALYTISPKYMSLLFTDPMGQSMVKTGAGFMLLGLYVTRRMIQIRV